MFENVKLYIYIYNTRQKSAILIKDKTFIFRKKYSKRWSHELAKEVEIEVILMNAKLYFSRKTAQ